MIDGTERYARARARGLPPCRPDGSPYDPETDRLAAAAEAWFFARVDGDPLPECYRADPGYDGVIVVGGHVYRVDVKHAGRLPFTGKPRMRPRALHLDPHSTKLGAPDVYALVAGPPFTCIGALARVEALALARLVDYGNGRAPVLVVDVEALDPLDVLLDRLRAWHA